MKQFLLAGVASVAALMMSSGTANAQCGYGGYGIRGGGFSIGYSSFSPRSSFSIGFGNYPRYGGARYSYRSPRAGHYDYHPGGFVPHGNHYHYVPGHYHWHRGRHW